MADDSARVALVGDREGPAGALAGDDRIDAVVTDPSEPGELADVDCVVAAPDPADGIGRATLETLAAVDADVPVVVAVGGDEGAPGRVVTAGVRSVTAGDDGALVDAVVDAAAEHSERRAAEREHRWLRELAANADDVFWSFTGDLSELLFVNDAYETVYGAPVDRLERDPTSFLEAIHPDDREDVRAAIETLSGGESIDIEYRVNAGTDYSRWVWVQGHPITEDGEVVRVVGFSRDVTERRHREEELERQNERLEEFASVVSHDLRNPLNTVDASLQLAAETGETEHFERGRRAIARMERLIDDLLTLARQGETVTEEEAVDLGRAVREAWSGVSGDAALTVDTDRAVMAEPTRLHQLLENLLRNAAEHGGEAVTVGTTEDGFYVADDGPGVPEGEREAIFERGYSTAEEGTGFGLRIVREVAQAQGWTVSVTDSDDGGARFDVTGVSFTDAEEAGWY